MVLAQAADVRTVEHSLARGKRCAVANGAYYRPDRGDDDQGLVVLHEVIAFQGDDMHAIPREPRQLSLHGPPQPQPTSIQAGRWIRSDGGVLGALLSGGDDNQRYVTEGSDAIVERSGGPEVDTGIDGFRHRAALLASEPLRPRGELPPPRIAAKRVEKHEPAGTLGLSRREQPSKEPAIGVPDQHVGRVDSGPVEEPLEILIPARSSSRSRSLVSSPASWTPGIASLAPNPARS
jgi:hypothetical protein